MKRCTQWKKPSRRLWSLVKNRLNGCGSLRSADSAPVADSTGDAFFTCFGRLFYLLEAQVSFFWGLLYKPSFIRARISQSTRDKSEPFRDKSEPFLREKLNSFV